MDCGETRRLCLTAAHPASCAVRCAVNNGHARNATVAVVERIGGGRRGGPGRKEGRMEKAVTDGWSLCFASLAMHPTHPTLSSLSPRYCLTSDLVMRITRGSREKLVHFSLNSLESSYDPLVTKSAERSIDQPARSSCLVFFFHLSMEWFVPAGGGARPLMRAS